MVAVACHSATAPLGGSDWSGGEDPEDAPQESEAHSFVTAAVMYRHIHVMYRWGMRRGGLESPGIVIIMRMIMMIIIIILIHNIMRVIAPLRLCRGGVLLLGVADGEGGGDDGGEGGGARGGAGGGGGGGG